MSPFLAILAFQAATIDPSKDPAFSKAITVRLPFATVRESVSAIAKASGQPLDVAATVADWKATVLVKGLSTGKTMEALADTLGLVWKKDGSFYRLTRADGTASAESAYVKDERDNWQKSLSDPQAVPGQPGTPQIAGAADPNQPPMRRRPGRGGPIPGTSASRVSYSYPDPLILAVEVSTFRPPTRLMPSFASGDSEFAKAAIAWPSIEKELSDDWNKPLSIAAPPKSIWENGGYVLGDLLAAWHDATGLPVVADAFRIPVKSMSLSAGTALGGLQALVGSERLSLRLADGVARLRHPAFWRLREQEIPEFTWNTIERGSPTLDSLAQFASGLKPVQAAPFRSLEAPMSKVKTRAIREAYPALLVWSAISPAARKALLSGTPVGLAAVRNATNTYAYALREAPFYGAGDPTQSLAIDPSKLGMFGNATPKSLELRLSAEPGGGVVYVIDLP